MKVAITEDDKMLAFANNKLNEIVERTGKPIMCAEIRKEKDSYGG